MPCIPCRGQGRDGRVGERNRCSLSFVQQFVLEVGIFHPLLVGVIFMKIKFNKLIIFMKMIIKIYF